MKDWPCRNCGADRAHACLACKEQEEPCRPSAPCGRPDCECYGETEAPTIEDTAEPTDGKPNKSASTLLVEIALEKFDLGVSDSGDAFAVPKNGPKIVGLLRGGKTSLRGLLARAFFDRHGKAPSQQALTDALLVIEGYAADADEDRLYLRVAEHDEVTWLDLGDTEGRAVAITSDGWQMETPPVKFKRTTLNSPLPEPKPGGDLAELWDWLNVAEADRPLILAWLVSTFLPDIPHPVLGLFGEQGTGKTTAEKLIVSLVDPSPVPVRQPPRDKESWVTAAAGSWVVGLDNLSIVPDWLSDTICRAVTGDGDVRRKLYTDGDHAVFVFRRCVVLTGIDLGALAGDLADRMLPIELQRISEDERREETRMWPGWSGVHPRLLGALLDLVAGVKAALPFVELASKPRMADFARVLAAVDKVTGTSGLDQYVSRQSTMARDSLTADPFVTAVAASVAGSFTGTAAELLDRVLAVTAVEGWRPPKGWPGSARAVTQRLKRQSPSMRKAGWEVADDGAANKDRIVKWTITPPAGQGGEKGAQEKTPKVPPPDPLTRHREETAGQADQATADSASAFSWENTEPGGEAGMAGQDSSFSLDGGTDSDNPPTAHMWWPASGMGQHGRDCTGCRTATGGPDHAKVAGNADA